ncbi:MAG: glycosyltransferase family 39 protein [Chloroflexota bacterium]
MNLLILFLISVFTWAPLTQWGAWQSRSGLAAAYDLQDLDSSWRAGRSLLDWAPSFLPAPEPTRFPYYLAQLFSWASVDRMSSIKLVYGLSLVLSAWTLYLFVRRLFGERAALLASVVYLFTPYRIVEIYWRGAFGESWFYTFAPLALWATVNLLDSGRRRWLVVLAFSTCLLFLAHLGLGVLFGGVILAYGLWLAWGREKSSRDKAWAVAGGLAAAVAAGFVLALPFFASAGWSTLAPAGDYARHFVHFFQLFSPAWGLGTPGSFGQESLPFQLGVVPVGLGLLALAIWYLYSPFQGETEAGRWRAERQVAFFLGLAVISGALMLGGSELLWRALSLKVLIGYPWQFLAFSTLALAVVAGSVLSTEARLFGLDFTFQALLIALAVVAVNPYLSARVIDPEDLPDLSRPPLARWGDRIVLLGYRLEGEFAAGKTIRLALFWQATGKVLKDYTVFTHVIDVMDRPWGQQDNQPLLGSRPTTSWEEGEVLRDDYDLVMSRQAPLGRYRLEVGMYLPSTGERLRVMGEGQENRVILGEYEIR